MRESYRPCSLHVPATTPEQQDRILIEGTLLVYRETNRVSLSADAMDFLERGKGHENNIDHFDKSVAVEFNSIHW